MFETIVTIIAVAWFIAQPIVIVGFLCTLSKVQK